MDSQEIRAEESVIEALDEVARAAYPEEGCAVLIGQARRKRTRLDTVLPARNVAADNRRRQFIIDPQALLIAQKAARQRENGVVAFFHSHPDHPAEPSPADRAAAWPGALHLIASVTSRGVVDLAAYSLDSNGTFQPLPLAGSGRARGEGGR